MAIPNVMDCDGCNVLINEWTFAARIHMTETMDCKNNNINKPNSAHYTARHMETYAHAYR